MKYKFSEEDKKLLTKLNLPFSPFKDLNDEAEMQLLETLSDKAGFGTIESDGYEDVLTHMAEQANIADIKRN